MRYIKLENNRPKHYTIEQLMMDVPNAKIYKRSNMPNKELLAKYDVYPLITEPMPVVKENEKAEESVPKFQNGEWHQTWIVRRLTEEEIDEILKISIGKNKVTDVAKLGDISKFMANEELQEQRYNTCKKCEKFTKLKTCQECGCIMPLKVKIASAECPLKKW